MQNMTVATDVSANLTSNAFTKEGYTFKGWATSESGSVAYTNGASYTMGTNSVYILYAVWEIVIYDIAYELNGGTNSASNPQKYTVEEKFSLEAPTRAGYKFEGWYTDSGFNSKIETIEVGTTGDKFVYAKWTIIVYSINYELNGVTVTNALPSTFTVEDLPITFPNANGDRAILWYTDSGFENRVEEINSLGNITLYAKFSGVVYKEYSTYAEVTDFDGRETDVAILSTFNGKPVTIIGNDAFYDCYSLTSIVIPDSVTSIGSEAFKYCSSMTSVVFEEGSVCKSIGEYAFEYCSSLTYIEITDSVTSIGKYAFSDCNSLTIYCEAVSKPSGWNSNWNSNCPVVWNCKNNEVASDGHIYTVIDGIRYGIKDNSATVVKQPKNIVEANIPSTISYKGTVYPVTSIGEYAFRYCSSLTSIVIPNSVTSIEENAFYNCRSLTSVNYLGTIEQWCNVSFKDDDANPLRYGVNLYFNGELVIELAIPNTVTKINNYAFAGCDSLTNIEIPDSVTSIGDRAFYGCNSLTSIDVDKNNTEYKSIDGNLYNKDGTILIQYTIGKKDTSFTISNSVTSIGGYAFYNCDSLTSIVIPDSVTSIGDEAFGYCSSLTSIVISDSVTSIGGYAFYDCGSLTIYCEVASQPSGWNLIWNYHLKCPVVWNCKNNDVADDGYIYTVINGVRYGIKDNVATVVEQPGNIVEANIPSTITYKDKVYPVTSVGDSAFYDCDSLTSIVIPDSVTSIGNFAFSGCSSLTSIVIPDSVTSIGTGAFLGCSSLRIYCEATSKPSGWNSNWNSNWNYSNYPVVWGHTHSYTDGKCVCGMKQN